MINLICTIVIVIIVLMVMARYVYLISELEERLRKDHERIQEYLLPEYSKGSSTEVDMPEETLWSGDSEG